MKCIIAAVALSAAGAAQAQSVAYLTYADEPWGQFGNVEALNDVFESWDRTFFSSPGDTLEHDVVIIDGGNGATAEFEAYVNTNRGALEDYVSGGGVLVIGAARWGGVDNFDLGFGITLHNGINDTGNALDDSHPVFDGPFGATGSFFDGDNLAHDTISGDDLQILMNGNDNGLPVLGEQSFGDGHVIAHGLTLAFFGVHDLWTPNCDAFLRNLYAYAGDSVGGGCPADVNGDGMLNVLDFVAFQTLWQSQDPAADCDDNGLYNILDFVCFQQLFTEGC